jgi:hypothetical protein
MLEKEHRFLADALFYVNDVFALTKVMLFVALIMMLLT